MIDIYDGNNVMRRAVEKRGLMQGEQFLSLRVRYDAACVIPQIWVWDGREHNDRRREIYPLYKTNRTPAAEDVFSQVRLWRQLLGHAPVTQIEVHGWEADDVIGTLVRKRPGVFRVHTNDMDYGQIAHLCELKGVNMKGVPPRWIALYKALNGDSSDNIKGIPGFGPKRWLEMQAWWPEIERAIVRGDPAWFAELPFKPAVAAWLASEDNVTLLQQMLTVTHFQNVPDDELNGGIITGTLNTPAADALMAEFFL